MRRFLKNKIKTIQNLQTTKDNGELAPVVMDALGALNVVQTAMGQIQKDQTTHQKVKGEAAKTAELKFQSMVKTLVTSGISEVEAVKSLEGKKTVLEKWVQTTYETSEQKVKEAVAKHAEADSRLNQKINTMILTSYEEFMKGVNKKKEIDTMNDDDLVKEMEESLNLALETQASMSQPPIPETEKPLPQPQVPKSASMAPPPVPERAAPPPPPPPPPQVPETQPPSPKSQPAVPVPETQVPEAKPPGSAQKAANQASLAATVATLQRQDTSQQLLTRANTKDLEEEELRKCAVEMPDGTFMYRNQRTGKLETLEDRQKRPAHNTYVAFSRSFEGFLVDG